MGAKCSCLCNKETDNTFNFYPDSTQSKDINDQQTPDIVVKSLFKDNNEDNISTSTPINNINEIGIKIKRKSKKQQSSSEDFEEKIKVQMPNIIKFQSIVRSYLKRKTFKIELPLKKKDHLTKIAEVINNCSKNISNQTLNHMKTKPFIISNFSKYFSTLSDESKQKIEDIRNKKKIVSISKSREKLLLNDKKDIQIVFTECLVRKERSSKNINITTVYTGQITIDYQMHGEGSLRKLNGEILEGSWVFNEFTGYGRKIDTFGNIFEGILFIKDILRKANLACLVQNII